MIKRLSQRFFRWFCHPDFYDEIQGDLEEIYRRNLEKSRLRAEYSYLFQVLGLLRPSLMRSFMRFNLNYNMIQNHFKISTRVLLKQKFYTGINILGLAVSMGVCLLIYQYIHFELSFDTYHEKASQKYRLVQHTYRQETAEQAGIFTSYAMGKAGRKELPEVIAYTQVRPDDVGLVVSNPERNQPHQENGIWYADQHFLQFFDFSLLHGNARSALQDQHSVVITKDVAERYFGTSQALGKDLEVMAGSLSGVFTVSAVLDKLPENSHLQFDMLLPMQFLINHWQQYQEDDGWGLQDFVTYVQLEASADIQNVSRKYEALLQRHISEEENESQTSIGLQPLTEIHLNSDFERDISSNHGAIGDIRFFALIALFILLMAWVNYVNLSTARAMNRAKEVGVRKTVGARQHQLIGQFITESFLVNLVAACLAIGFALLALPVLNDIVDQTLNFSVLREPQFWIGFSLLLLLGPLLAGLYPAFVLSSFRPLQVLVKMHSSFSGGRGLRRGLITFQFLMAIILIAGTYLVYQQITYMKNKDLGFDAEKILVVNGPRVVISQGREVLESKYPAFKNKVERHHAVLSVSGGSSVPGKGYMYSFPTRKLGQPKDRQQSASFVLADADLTETYDFDFLAGEGFSEQLSRRDGTLINTEAVRAFQLGSAVEAVGESLVFLGDTLEVLGVVENVHWSSLKESHAPTLFVLDDLYNVYFSFKINTNNISESIAHIRSVYREVFPEDPFYYYFLDEDFNRQYQADLRFRNLFSAFSSFAVLIAMIGLFALVSFSTSLRIKEIGIRKVLGANVRSLMLLLSQEYLYLLLLATVLAVPVIIIVGRTWLNNYAYRISLGPDHLLLPGLALLVISLACVSYRTYRTAHVNPAKTLRSDN